MNGRWEKGVDKGKFTDALTLKESVWLKLIYCLIREESLDIVKEFRIGDLTSYSDHTILNTELVSDKSIEDEFHKVQSKNAKQNLQSRDDSSP